MTSYAITDANGKERYFRTQQEAEWYYRRSCRKGEEPAGFTFSNQPDFRENLPNYEELVEQFFEQQKE